MGRRRVDTAVRDRQRFRGPRERGGVGHNEFEHGAHARDRLDRDDRGAARDQLPRELAGAGGDVEHGASRTELELLHQPVDNLTGVAGAAALVRGRSLLESARCLSVNAHRSRAFSHNSAISVFEPSHCLIAL